MITVFEDDLVFYFIKVIKVSDLNIFLL